MYTDANVYYVMPHDTRMLIVNDSVGGCRCESGVPCLSSRDELKNDVLIVVSDIEALDSFQTTSKDGVPFLACRAGRKTHTETYYDLTTDDAVQVSTDQQTVTLNAKTVLVSGNGCNEQIVLP
jgi:hypothetical protein